MAKCLYCERKSIFLRVDSEGYCKQCAPRVAARRRAEAAQRKEEEQRRRDAEAAEAKRLLVESAKRQVELEANIRMEPSTIDLDLCRRLRTDFLAFDVETTGLSSNSDRIVEISAVRFVDGVPVDTFCELVNAGVSIPPAATRVNHITNEMISSARPESLVLSEFLSHFNITSEQEILVCSHNASFDMGFLRAALIRHGIVRCASYVDTLSLSREYIKNLDNYKLGTVAKHFSIEANSEHRADSDALTCGRILISLLPLIEKPFLEEEVIKQKEKAYEEIRSSLEIFPVHSRIAIDQINYSDGFSSGSSYYFRGDLYMKTNHHQKALEQFDLARAKGYCSPALYMSYATLFRRLREYDDEISILEEGISRLGELKKHELLARRNRAIELLIVSREKNAKKEMLLAEKQERARLKQIEMNSKPSAENRSVGRRVRQLNDSGDIVAEYDSVTSASVAVGVNTKSIRSAAIGSQRHAGGYKWEYVEEND